MMAHCVNMITDDEENIPELHAYARDGHIEAMRRAITRSTINSRTENGSTPLHEAAHHGHVDAVRLLVTQGAGVDLADRWGHTPLHLASIDGSADVVQALLELKANHDVENSRGKTALYLAVEECHADVMEALISAGANVNHCDHEGCAPLHRCIEYLSETGGLEIAKVLLTNGADLNMTNKHGKTPLQLAKSITLIYALCSSLPSLKPECVSVEMKSTQTSEQPTERVSADIEKRVNNVENKINLLDEAMANLQSEVIDIKRNTQIQSEKCQDQLQLTRMQLGEARSQLSDTSAKVDELVNDLRVRHQIRKLSASKLEDRLWMEIFQRISNAAARCWPNIFRVLTRDCLPNIINVENQIDVIRHGSASILDQAYNSLVTAHRLCGMNFNLDLVIGSLRSCDQNLLADQLQACFSPDAILT